MSDEVCFRAVCTIPSVVVVQKCANYYYWRGSSKPEIVAAVNSLEQDGNKGKTL